MSSDIENDDSLDRVYAEIGEFKIYQMFLILLLCIPSVLPALFTNNFIFAAATLDYR